MIKRGMFDPSGKSVLQDYQADFYFCLAEMTTKIVVPWRNIYDANRTEVAKMSKSISEQIFYIVFVETTASIACIAIYLSFLWMFDPNARKVFLEVMT